MVLEGQVVSQLGTSSGLLVHSLMRGRKTYWELRLVISFVFLGLFSPTAECYGVSAQYRFRCVLGEVGRFREKTGSRKVPGTVPGTG